MKTCLEEIETEEDLLEYLHYQFPSTAGHSPLEKMIHKIWLKGYDKGYNTGMNDVANLTPTFDNLYNL